MSDVFEKKDCLIVFNYFTEFEIKNVDFLKSMELKLCF